MTFFQMLGGVVGLAIGGAVFEGKLSANLAKYAPGVSVEAARSPLAIRSLVSGQELINVIQAYIESLKWVYVSGPPIAAAAFVLLILVKQRPLGPPGGGAAKPKDVEKAEQIKQDVEESAAVPAGVDPALFNRSDSGLTIQKQSFSVDGQASPSKQ